jgi:hypothetical protein
MNPKVKSTFNNTCRLSCWLIMSPLCKMPLVLMNVCEKNLTDELQSKNAV